MRLISSDRFSRFIDFGVRHFVVLATGDARFVRLTTFVGLAGHAAARAPVAFLDRFRRRATSSGWHDVEPIAGIPVIIRNVMKALLCSSSTGFWIRLRPSAESHPRRTEEKRRGGGGGRRRRRTFSSSSSSSSSSSMKPKCGNIKCRCRVCARENARRRFRESLSLFLSRAAARKEDSSAAHKRIFFF